MSHELYPPSPFASAPWEDINMDFILELPRTTKGFDSIFMVVDRPNKIAHFILCHKMDDINNIFRFFFRKMVKLHGLSQSIVLDRDPKFIGHFFRILFEKLGTKLKFSISYHPQNEWSK